MDVPTRPRPRSSRPASTASRGRTGTSASERSSSCSGWPPCATTAFRYANRPQDETFRARTIELVDAAGRPAARIAWRAAGWASRSCPPCLRESWARSAERAAEIPRSQAAPHGVGLGARPLPAARPPGSEPGPHRWPRARDPAARRSGVEAAPTSDRGTARGVAMRPRGRLCHAAWARAFVALVTTFEDVSLGRLRAS